MKYARRITMKLKPNTAPEFTKVLDSKIVPLLHKQKGFQDMFVLVGPTATEAFAISMWDSKENAEAYATALYPEVLKNLAGVIEGTPQVHTFEVLSSTVTKKTTAVAA
jgi:heme-degrading monooxygenase HmoA